MTDARPSLAPLQCVALGKAGCGSREDCCEPALSCTEGVCT